MDVNTTELQRKYESVKYENNKVVFNIDPYAWGQSFDKNDGIWDVDEKFIARLYGDLLHALNYEPGSKEATMIQHRIIFTKDNKVIVEFSLKVADDNITTGSAMAIPYAGRNFLFWLKMNKPTMEEAVEEFSEVYEDITDNDVNYIKKFMRRKYELTRTELRNKIRKYKRNR